MLGDKPVEFFDNLLDGISKVIEAVISHIPEIIGSVIKGVGNVVGSVFTGIAGLFGFGSSDNHEEMLERQEKYNNALDSASKAVAHFTDELEKSYGALAIQNAEGAEGIIEESMKTIIKGIDSVLWDNYGGGHSDYYHANKALNWQGGDLQNAGIIDFMKQYGVNAWDAPEGKYTWNALFNNNNPEKLAKMFKDMRDSGSDLWRIITTEMGANGGALKEWIEKLISAYDQIDENSKLLKEQLTTTTADNVYDDYLNSLYELAEGSEDVFDDIADNWQKMVNKMVINNIIGAKQQQALQDWYDNYLATTFEEGISEEEYQNRINAAKEEYDRILQEGVDEVTRLRDMGLVSASDSTYKQEASTRGFQAMSQDTGEELNGRFTALQIAGESINGTSQLMLNTLTEIHTLVYGHGATFSELRNLAITRNSYLEDIAKYSKGMYNEFKPIIQSISDYTSTLGRK